MEVDTPLCCTSVRADNRLVKNGGISTERRRDYSAFEPLAVPFHRWMGASERGIAMSTLDGDAAAKAKAEREAAESAARKAAHDESAAKVADAKAYAEFEEWKLGADGRKRAAELAAEATRLDNLSKLQAAVGSATPDLKGIERGKTTAPDDVLYSTLLTTNALASAASKVMKVVKRTDTNAYRIFITSDPDLLSRDAHLRSLSSRLRSLTSAVSEFPRPREETRMNFAGPALVGAATAVAKLIPGLVELFAVNRTLTGKAITIEEEQAVTAVAGALAAAEGGDFLKFDDTRFLTGDTDIQKERDALEAATITLQVDVARERNKPEIEQDAGWLAAAAIVMKAGQDALAALDTVPAGAKISPLAAAMATELIRDSDMQFILVIRPAGGSAAQLINDRPLAMKDPIYIAGSVALSYRLIKRDTSQIVAAGIVAGSAEMSGTLSSTINLTRSTEITRSGGATADSARSS
ncbi:hypothetical protein ACX80W_10095 [Arthrobacter sp. TMN-37]